MTTIKFILYIVMVTCFLIAGAIDIYEGHTKLGLISIEFGLCNAFIFFWRP